MLKNQLHSTIYIFNFILLVKLNVTFTYKYTLNNRSKIKRQSLLDP